MWDRISQQLVCTTGRCYLQWYGSHAELGVAEPELIKEVLNDREKAYPKSQVREFVRKLLGDGLTESKGEKWAKIRKLANHAFQTENLKVSASAFLI